MTRDKIIGFAILALLIAGIAYVAMFVPLPGATNAEAEEMEVRDTVTNFGNQLQLVSLLAPTAVRASAMDEAYGSYVAPELLAQWTPEGAEALGRYSSSPWPDRIEIVEVRHEAVHYIVEGNVIEVAADETGMGQATAAVYPVTLTLEKRNGQWLIVAMSKGAYSEVPQRRTIVGYWECLPHKDATVQTKECAPGIAVDQSDGHYAVDTKLMSQIVEPIANGTKVRVSGVVTPVTHLSSEQIYNIDGVISATTIEKVL